MINTFPTKEVLRIKEDSVEELKFLIVFTDWDELLSKIQE